MPDRRKHIISLPTLLFGSLLIILGLWITLELADSAQAVTPLKNGDWIINDNTIYSDQLIELNGNISIQNGASLKLTNVTLVMNCSFDGEYNITVLNGGSLVMEDHDSCKATEEDMGEVTSNATSGSHGYGFWAESGSTISLTGVKISNCGWENYGVRRGLTILCDNSMIKECIFQDNFVGVFYNQTTGGKLLNSNFTWHEYRVVYLVESASTTIKNCNMTGGGGDHCIFLLKADNNIITDNIISGFHDVYPNEAGTDEYWWKTIYCNLAAGVWLNQSDNNLIQSNTIRIPAGARGIWLRHSDHNQVLNNLIDGENEDNKFIGILLGLLNASHNNIEGNVMDREFVGLYLNYHSNYNRIESNFIDFSSKSIDVGDSLAEAWGQFEGRCDFNYFGNNTLNQSDFHSVIISDNSQGNHFYNTHILNAYERKQRVPCWGFLINTAHNNTIEKTYMFNNSIFIVGVGCQWGSNGNIIRNNEFWNEGFRGEGVLLIESCMNNLIINNTVYGREYSISVAKKSQNNTVMNNRVYDCEWGIIVSNKCKNNLVVGNRVNGTDNPGIHVRIRDSIENLQYFNIVKENEVWDCDVGIKSEPNSFNTTAQGNFVHDCDVGILFDSTSGHIVLDNIIEDCNVGIKFIGSSNITIMHNILQNCKEKGILLSLCNVSKVRNNTLEKNPMAIHLVGSVGTSIMKNYFDGNIETMVYDLDLEAIFQENTISNQKIGFSHKGGKLVVEACIFMQNQHGVRVVDNKDLTLRNCSFLNNSGFGVLTQGEAEATLLNPTFQNNGGGGAFTMDRSKIFIEVDEISEITGDRLNLRGGILIKDGGELKIVSSFIGLKCDNPGESMIKVEAGGLLLVDQPPSRTNTQNLNKSTIYGSGAQPYFFQAWSDSQIEMYGTTIMNCGKVVDGTDSMTWGLGLEDCTAVIRGCTFRETDCALVLKDCNMTVQTTSFYSSQYWVFMMDSELVLDKCVFLKETQNTVTLLSGGSQLRIENGSFPQEDYELVLKVGSTAVLTNIYIEPDNLICDQQSNAIVRFEYIINFNDPNGVAFSHLNYTLMDGLGISQEKGSLGDQGQTSIHYLTSFSMDGLVLNLDHNPHVITVSVNEKSMDYEFNVFGVGREEFVINFAPISLVDNPFYEFQEGGTMVGMIDLNEWYSDEGAMDFSFFCTGDLVVMIGADGVVNIYPMDREWSGSQYVRFRATDDYGLYTEINVSINVTPVDDAPVLEPLPDIYLGPGEIYFLDLYGIVNDIDTSSEALIFTVNPHWLEVNGRYMTINYNESVQEMGISILVSDGSGSDSGWFKVHFLDEKSPVFRSIPDQIVYPDTEKKLDLSDYFRLTQEQQEKLKITVSSQDITVLNHTLALFFSGDKSNEKVLVFYDLDSVIYVKMFNVTVFSVNTPPEIIENYLSNINSKYTFGLLLKDKEGDMPAVKLFLNGAQNPMVLGAGDMINGGMFNLSFELSPGDYEYYYVVDDHKTNNFNFEVKETEFQGASVSSSQEWPWWIILLIVICLLMIIIVAIMVISSRLDQKKKEEELDKLKAENEAKQKEQEEEAIGPQDGNIIGEVLECPMCGEEVGEEDESCLGCGVEFVE